MSLLQLFALQKKNINYLEIHTILIAGICCCKILNIHVISDDDIIMAGQTQLHQLFCNFSKTTQLCKN